MKEKYLLEVYNRYPVKIKRAEGNYIYDEKGRKYLDFITGIAVNILGNRNKKIIKAIERQLKKYLHVSNLFHQSIQEEYAKYFQKISFNGKIFFSNSGAEANETALKLVRKTGNGKILSFYNSFHGRTLFTLSATGQEKIRKGFKSLKDFVFAEFNNIKSIKNILKKHKISGIIVEPIQGEAGVYPAKKEFLIFLRNVADKLNIPLIFDEIQTGLGRTGYTFAYKYYRVKPDILTSGKAAGGGLPLGVTLFSDKYALLYRKGEHASTFGGNPLSLSAGLVVLKYLASKKNILKIRKKGKIIKNKLNKLLKENYKNIKEIRGFGLIYSIEFYRNCAVEIRDFCIKNGLLINNCKENILRLLPALTVSEKEIDFAVRLIQNGLRKI